jgi:hypothetical protein
MYFSFLGRDLDSTFLLLMAFATMIVLQLTLPTFVGPLLGIMAIASVYIMTNDKFKTSVTIDAMNAQKLRDNYEDMRQHMSSGMVSSEQCYIEAVEEGLHHCLFDHKLVSTLLDLCLFRNHNVDAVFKSITYIELYYKKYRQMLLNHVSSGDFSMEGLHCLRNSCLNEIGSLHISAKSLKEASKLHAILDIVRARTYKCISIISKKYGIPSKHPQGVSTTVETNSFAMYV